jgi:hypothetical protein
VKEVLTMLRTVRPAYWVILGLVSITAFSTVYYRMSEAACYSGTVLGRSCYRGYFTNVVDHGGTFVLPTISNNQAIPATTVNSADALYNLLRAAYDSGNAQKRSGASFIYNTMKKNTAPGAGRNISNAQWINLRDSLRGLDQAGKIDWGANVSVAINSYWQGTDSGFANDGIHDDDAYYENFKNETGITIRDYDNNVVYQILRRCANPVGYPGGVPEPRNYKLTPHINPLPGQVEVGTKLTVTASVDNEGETQSQPTQWEVTEIDVKSGKQAPHENNAGANANAPCQSGGGAASGNYFRDGNSTCKNVKKGTTVFRLGAPSPDAPPGVQVTIGDLEAGTRVCFALSVKPHSSTDARWMHSQPLCTTVGKRPKVQIWGGDLAVRGKIETSTSVKDIGGTKVFGSWVEYGVFSVGTNTRFASASGLNGQTNNAQSAWSKLTFANIDDTGAASYGNYAAATNFRPAPGIASYFAALPGKQPIGTGSVDLSNPALAFTTGSTPVVRTAGNLKITGGNIGKGHSVVIIASGTVTIEGSITYTDETLSSPQDIPQVVIIAGNINIHGVVKQVDAWLVASGTINTCNDFAGNLTSNKCNQSLAVNGPVVTGKLVLNRTAGSGTGAQSGDPAERFNLRPDAFLWAQLQASGNNKAQTVYSTELPPRF